MMGNPLPLADSGVGLNYVAGQGNNNGDGDDEVFAEPVAAANGGSNQNGLARSRRSHLSRKESTPESKAAREKLEEDRTVNPLKTNTCKCFKTKIKLGLRRLVPTFKRNRFLFYLCCHT